eukprot:3386957-Alexandrium_andersonii.AAC.1
MMLQRRLYSLAPDGSLRWSIMAGKEPNWTIRLMPKISSPVLAGRRAPYHPPALPRARRNAM